MLSVSITGLILLAAAGGGTCVGESGGFGLLKSTLISYVYDHQTHPFDITGSFLKPEGA
jgi:hypothetical protein